MNFRKTLFCAFSATIFFAIFSCQKTVKDIHSYANINDITIKHINLDLSIDFKTKQISGIASLEINNLTETDKLILDVWDLEIIKVHLDDDENETAYKLELFKEKFGQPLSIKISPDCSSAGPI